AHLRLGKYEEAAAELARAAEEYPVLRDYALFHRAEALHRGGRSAEALPLLKSFLSAYPDSLLARKGALLLADTQASTGETAAALESYRRFVETYASGSDALSAALRGAECLEKLGRREDAAREYRRLWLSHPASPVSARAEENLRRLYAAGLPEEPPTPEELLRRGGIQYDMKQYEAALKTFSSIPAEGGGEEFARRLGLRKGQAQFRLRRYADAEHTFALLVEGAPEGERGELRYWLAKAQDKTGKPEEALASYLAAARDTRSQLADDALLEGALIHKFQERYAEELKLLGEHLERFPKSELRSRVLWEAGWGSYMSGDHPRAASFFGRLTADDQFADRALYWLGKSLAAAGDREGSAAAYQRLLRRAPYGYYASRYRKQAGLPQQPARVTDRDLLQALPLPAGMERVKALVALGMKEEAAEELGQLRRKLKPSDRKGLAGIARMYLELGDHNGAMKLVKETPASIDPDSEHLWKLAYPRPFREAVSRNAARNRLPEPLVYSLMKAESSFSPTALSPVGAVGLMQLMPSTARAVAAAEKDHFEVSRLKVPEVNIRYGTR
ncbi:MAG TPA: tetratricopeptide repeat protein, partial [Verrucomicrobiae bacterium]|nr:tetratricopeptide repeat protein [Verrucomicrobiae bacterium]